MNHLNQFLHILNPSESERSAVSRFFRQTKRVPHVWIEKRSHPTHLETVLEWALLQGVKKIAIWGGDGSFSRSIQWLYLHKKLDSLSFALVPVGTGNDFSRTLKLWPWKKHVDRLFSDQSTSEKFDLGLLTGRQGKRIFVNNAGFGRSPSAVAKIRTHPVRDILSLRAKRLQVEWETSGARCVETTRALMAIVFNAPYFNRGLYFDNTISPQDGLLRGVFIPPTSPFRLLWRFMKGRMGKSLSHEKDFWVEGESIEVEGEEKLYPQVDGERVFRDGERKLSFSVMRNALSVYI